MAAATMAAQGMEEAVEAAAAQQVAAVLRRVLAVKRRQSFEGNACTPESPPAEAEPVPVDRTRFAAIRYRVGYSDSIKAKVWSFGETAYRRRLGIPPRGGRKEAAGAAAAEAAAGVDRSRFGVGDE